MPNFTYLAPMSAFFKLITKHYFGTLY